MDYTIILLGENAIIHLLGKKITVSDTNKKNVLID
jgi:hypothetical protein